MPKAFPRLFAWHCWSLTHYAFSFGKSSGILLLLQCSWGLTRPKYMYDFLKNFKSVRNCSKPSINQIIETVICQQVSAARDAWRMIQPSVLIRNDSSTCVACTTSVQLVVGKLVAKFWKGLFQCMRLYFSTFECLHSCTWSEKVLSVKHTFIKILCSNHCNTLLWSPCTCCMCPMYTSYMYHAYLNWFCFRFGRHFELPLLAQSVVMIVTMFAMVHLCTVVKAKSEIIASKPRVFGGKWLCGGDCNKRVITTFI